MEIRAANVGDEVVGVSHAGGGEDIGIGDAVGAIGDVEADGVGEDDGVLGDEADLGAEGGEGDGCDIDVIDEDAAGGRREEAEEERNECSFSGAVGADERGDLALVDGEGHVVENAGGGVGGVGEGDVFEADGAGEGGEGDFGIWNLGLGSGMERGRRSNGGLGMGARNR